MSSPKTKGFTLVELLVVIAIIGVLVALLLPAVQAAREAARRTQCTNNLKQLALGFHNYHDSYHTFPPTGIQTNAAGWNVLILPYIEQQAIHEGFDFSHVPQPGRTVHESQFRGGWSRFRLTGFLCPSNPNIRDCQTGWPHEYFNTETGDRMARGTAGGTPAWTTHYYGVAGPIGFNPWAGGDWTAGSDYKVDNITSSFGGNATQGSVVFPHGAAIGSFTDGTSNTLLLGEVSWSHEGVPAGTWAPATGFYRMWTRGVYNEVGGRGLLQVVARNVEFPINSKVSPPWNSIPFGSEHPGGAIFANADGSVAFRIDTLDMTIYRALASRNGKESVSAP